ncbi:hypothetical protein [Sphingomonas abietis]|uniref:Autotransporter outer membrane beta-barrel domain-containing protein n=1 Tax=Sphingomonas abietis TaxID=3012344 RepID=A0ABY7NL52_9SPHN|nr:hypothetical protein [Sphingomonas abietis]WBO22238.1 hypothetical protein PBT88_19150 [Sphingomonas abietis]
MRIVFLPLLLLPIAAPAVALPLVSATGITVGVTGGTLGVGPEVTYKINPLLGVRASATFLGVDGHGHVSDYKYDGHARLRNFGGSIDLHPLANGFRLSAGVRSTNDNRIRFHGMARTNQTYGGVTYTPDEAGTLSGDIRTRSVSPILTVGYAHTTLSGFMFGIDGGVMFHGHPRVDNLVATGELGSNPAAQDELARQEQRLRDRVDNYPYYPVAQISLGYRF